MIDDIRPQVGKSGGARPVHPADAPQRPAEAARPAAKRTDSVQISEAARARLAEASAEGLAPERIAEIRQKIAEGAYNTDAVKTAVARKILSSGDLDG